MASILKNNLRGGHTAFLLRLVHESLPAGRLAIAVSGGLDSMSLLHAAVQVRGVDLFVFHVHHGLHEQAGDWLMQVKQFCLQHQIEFDARQLDASIRRNAQSIEDWARQARYQALAEMARQHDVPTVWLAQHEDDQIETYLLQKNRGAGARGLSAMPAQLSKLGVTWQRPWLSATQTQITEYAAHHQIKYIHDPSNDDTRFARNRLRQDVQRMSVAERRQILHHIAQAQQQNAQDNHWAQAILQQHHAPHRSDIGECARLHNLNLNVYDVEQQYLLLRAWFAQLNLRMPTRAALHELIKQLNNPNITQHMCWRHPDGWAVARFRTDMIIANLMPQGTWCLSPALAQWVADEGLRLCARMGGERFRLGNNRPKVSLKEAYQMAGVAPMLRSQLPLIYRDDRLIFVVGVGVVTL